MRKIAKKKAIKSIIRKENRENLKSTRRHVAIELTASNLSETDMVNGSF